MIKLPSTFALKSAALAVGIGWVLCLLASDFLDNASSSGVAGAMSVSTFDGPAKTVLSTAADCRARQEAHIQGAATGYLFCDPVKDHWSTVPSFSVSIRTLTGAAIAAIALLLFLSRVAERRVSGKA